MGREWEIGEIERLLTTKPLVTLVGAPGVGKTRLALEVARRLRDQRSDGVWHYPDGIWHVDLASIASQGLVPGAVATKLGLREEPGCSITETVIVFLKSRNLLLVLDNCEHLISECAALAEELVQSCPHLSIVATSREALRVTDEIPWRVPSLTVPDPHWPGSIDNLSQFESVWLFIERVPGFSLTSQNAATVVEICHRLDGIPLALELAAARAETLTVEQIATRLNQRFGLLIGGPRTALRRYQTMMAAIDWSYDMLSEAEQMPLRRLSVFAGGWMLEAAEVMCAFRTSDRSGGVHHLASNDTYNLLDQLVGKSLVEVEEPVAGERRFRLLESVRQYAMEKLVEAGEAEPARTGHRDWFLDLAEHAEPQLHGPYQEDWLMKLERENDNLRSTLEWSLRETDGRVNALRLVTALN